MPKAKDLLNQDDDNFTLSENTGVDEDELAYPRAKKLAADDEEEAEEKESTKNLDEDLGDEDEDRPRFADVDDDESEPERKVYPAEEEEELSDEPGNVAEEEEQPRPQFASRTESPVEENDEYPAPNRPEHTLNDL